MSQPRALVTRITFALLLFQTSWSGAAEDSPSFVDSLPANTAAYLHVPDYRRLALRAGQTAPGRFADDPELSAFAAGFAQTFLDFLFPASQVAREEAVDGFGPALREAPALPLGEALAAWIPNDDGGLDSLLILEARREPDAVRPLFESRREQLARDSEQVERQTLDGGELLAFTAGAGRSLGALAERDGLFAFADRPETIREWFAALDGDGARRLSDEPRLRERMTAFRDRADGDYHAEWYVDPIALYRGAIGANPVFGLDPAAVPALGLDGLHGLVGRLTLATKRYDLLFEMELWLDEPRAGAAALVTLGEGETAAENWAPREAATYATLLWDVPRSRLRLTELIDAFEGHGAGDELLAQELPLAAASADHEELLRALAGRFSYVAWFDGPPGDATYRRLWGIKMHGGTAPQAAAAALTAEHPSDCEKREYLGQPYWLRRSLGEDYVERTAAHCPLGEYLLLGDSAESIERAIATERGQEAPLADELDYKLFANRQRRLEGETPAGLVHFHRPEAYLRHIHALAASEDSRSLLETLAAQHPVYRALARAVDRHPLPAFERFEPYLAPLGGALSDDGVTLRYTFFAQRRRSAAK